jgi:glycosyltransferase involved in cell wall biosynthesis
MPEADRKQLARGGSGPAGGTSPAGTEKTTPSMGKSEVIKEKNRIPLVSVIIPLYNKEDRIAGTIKSVLSQSFDDFEVIVVNDGSRDRSAEAVEPFLADLNYVEQANSGPGAARNRGIELARGKYIAFLDADDKWLPEKLQTQVKFMEAHPDLQWSGMNTFLEDGSGNVPSRTLVPYELWKSTDWLIFENWFDISINTHISPTSSVIVRAAAVNEVGGFDPSIPAGQDMDLWIRLASRFPEYGFCCRPFVRYCHHLPGCISLAGERKYRSMLRYLSKQMGSEDLTSGSNPALFRYIRSKMHQLVRVTMSLGYPGVAGDAVERMPAAWKSPSMWFFHGATVLPGSLLRRLGDIRRRIFRTEISEYRVIPFLMPFAGIISGSVLGAILRIC